MKRLSFLAAFLLTALFYNSSFAQESGWPIFGDLHKMHDKAFVSYESKGPSYKYSSSASDEKDKPISAVNLGVMLTEAIFYGGAMSSGFNEKSGGLFVAKDDVDGVYNPTYYDYNTPLQKKPIYLYLSEEPEFVVKRSKSSFGGTSNTTITALNYLQLPVLINYATPVSKNTAAIHAGIGVYFAYGLSGKFKNTGQATTKVQFGNSTNDDFKRSDFGVAINAGYMFLKRWDAFINYGIGLKNLSTQPDETIHIKGFSLNVGYQFF